MMQSYLRQVFIRQKWNLRRSRFRPDISRSFFSGQKHDHKTKVPQAPVITAIEEQESLPKIEVDLEMVQLLEKLSLVNFGNKDGLERLKAAISLADQLSVVNTDGVEPMITVLEDRTLALAEDKVTVGNMTQELLSCAQTTLEDYFVVPPGNIAFSPEEEYYQRLDEEKEGSA